MPAYEFKQVKTLGNKFPPDFYKGNPVINHKAATREPKDPRPEKPSLEIALISSYSHKEKN